MDEGETTDHTYTVTETTHHVPEIYWLNKHFWFDDWERVKNNPEIYDTEAYTITGVRFNPDETPNEGEGNPDGRSIWLRARSDFEMNLDSDNPHHADSKAKCSESDSYLTKTETLLGHLGYSYESHEVINVELNDNNDGLHVTIVERLEDVVKSQSENADSA